MNQNGAGVARAEIREDERGKPAASGIPIGKSRRSLLDLAPLELDCMQTLWALQEATVREIRDALAIKLPRAYTTIMTIMDRLTRKGVVERHKTGRSYVYRAQLSGEDARRQAMRQVVEHFFGGSCEAAAGYLKAPEVAEEVCTGESSSAETSGVAPGTAPIMDSGFSAALEAGEVAAGDAAATPILSALAPSGTSAGGSSGALDEFPAVENTSTDPLPE